MSRVAFLVLMASPAAAGALIIMAHDRSWRGLLALRIRHVWLIWLAAVVQGLRRVHPSWMVQEISTRDGLVPTLVIWAAAAAFCVANLRTVRSGARPGLAAFALGLTLNTLASVLNGGMPYSAHAARLAGVPTRTMAAPLPGHHVLTAHSHLPALTDVLALPGWGQVISVGDVLLIAGLAWLLVGIAVGAGRSGTAPSPLEVSTCGPARIHPTTEGGVRP